MNNAAEQRLRLIELLLIDFGSVKRETVSKYFGVSAAQATRDLKSYSDMCGVIGYNSSSKRYELTSKLIPHFQW